MEMSSITVKLFEILNGYAVGWEEDHEEGSR